MGLALLIQGKVGGEKVSRAFEVLALGFDVFWGTLGVVGSKGLDLGGLLGLGVSASSFFLEGGRGGEGPKTLDTKT